MRKMLFAASSAILVGHAALAMGSRQSQLALAALVAENSPQLSSDQRPVMADLLDGNLQFQVPPGEKISVAADSVVCRESNVNIAAHSCVLTFGGKPVTITGRKAHELYATIVEVGVPADGAAGTIYEGMSRLVCTIDPTEIQQQDGGGADCTFTPGPP